MGADISPDEYDLIVVGTGLQESLIAAAAAKQKKTVLHLDPADYYGSQWTSFQLDQFLDWCNTCGCTEVDSSPPTSAAAEPQTQLPVGNTGSHASHETAREDAISANCNSAADDRRSSNSEPHGSAENGAERMPASSAEQRPVLHVPVAASGGRYSHAEINRAEGAELGPPREYNIDLAPRVVHCAGSLINALLDAGAQNYLEFKLLQQSYVWREGRFVKVPASRADIFKDRSLSPVDKRALMRFLQKAQQTFLGQQSTPDRAEVERSFVEMLREEGLAQPLRDVIMYALACIPRCQEGSAPTGCPVSQKHTGHTVSREEPGLTGCPVSAAEGMAALVRYMESVGRYGVDTAAFLVPMYGGGELPQAFCRVAAVAGALYVLRQPVAAIMLTSARGSRLCTGITTGSGQVLKCKALAANSETFGALLPAESSPDDDDSALERHSQAVAIIDGPLQEDESQVLVVMPPGSVGNPHPVYVLQVGSATACSPAGRYLLYLSTPSEAPTATQDLQPAMDALVDMRGISSSTASSSATHGQGLNAPDIRPKALLVAYYNRVASSQASALQHLPVNTALCDPPDATTGYESVLQQAQVLLQRLFPEMQEGLFPGGGNADGDESDEEAIEAISEALGDLAAATT